MLTSKLSELTPRVDATPAQTPLHKLPLHFALGL